MSGFSNAMESKIMPIAGKFARQRHLVAIRDAFMSLLPINLMGGLVAIFKSPPVTADTTNGFLLAWKALVSGENISWVLEWLYAFTLGAMSLYICIGVVYYLCKHYEIALLHPLLLSLAGFVLVVGSPTSLSWSGKEMSFGYFDGKGLIPALFIAILTVELYRLMRAKNFGRISMPSTVPESLSSTFATMIPGMVLLVLYILIFSIFNAMDTSFPQWMYSALTPAFQLADSLGSVIFITILTHFLWFFGIHDAALSGIVGPIRDGNLSINAGAAIAGEALPAVFTTPFWVYFVAIGGCGATLGLCLVLLTCKSKQIKTVAKVGLIPALFNISEPIIFGLPLMLNPIFFIPFLGAATVNAIIAFILMSTNFLSRTFALVSWQMPSIFGAFFSTLDWKAPVLIVLLIVLDALIYLPFVKIYDKQQVKLEQEAEDAEGK